MSKRLFPAVLAVLVALAAPLFPVGGDAVYAAENTQIRIEQTGGYFAVQGDNNVALKARVTNNSGASVSFSAKTGLAQTGSGLTEPNPSSGTVTLGAGQSTELVFSIDVASNATLGSQPVNVLLIDKGTNTGDVLRSKTLTISVAQKTTTQPAEYPGNYFAAADLVHTLSPGEAVLSGTTNQLTLSFFNKGNTVMKDAKVTLGLPSGVTLVSASTTLSVGYVTVGDSKTVVFPVTADADMESGNYPFTVTISFLDKENSSHSIEQTLYIPVSGTGGTVMQDVSITGIEAPAQAEAGKDFTLQFRVANNGSASTGQLKVAVEVPDGLVNRTRNLFLEPALAAGESRSFSVTLFSRDGAAEKNYTIPITVEPATGGDEFDRVQQYAGVFLSAGGSGSIKTPQLMVTSYSYGGSYVHAGNEFVLDLALTNTSSVHTLQNIKVTLDSGDGTFIPVRSSNSFYISKIDRNGTAREALSLSVKPDADQKTTSVNITMSYEDTAGNAYTSTDVISIPVLQDTRLLVDEIIAPPELFVGMQSYVNTEFYNMGKTTLYNLRVTAEGDFDTMESISYFVGNMTAGQSDTYDFSFLPRAVGPMAGTVIFTYEDASGNEQRLEKPFEFQVMEMPVWEEPPMPGEEIPGQSAFPWIPVLIGAAVVAAVVGFILHRRRRRKKMHEELEINE